MDYRGDYSVKSDCTYWYSDSVYPSVLDPLPILFYDPGVPVGFKDLFCVRPMCDIQITLCGCFGKAEWSGRNPWFQNEPRAYHKVSYRLIEICIADRYTEVDTTLFAITIKILFAAFYGL